MKKNVIIVAGGRGVRMGASIPKQFIPIGGKEENASVSKPILMYTIEKFSPFVDNIILVLPPQNIDYWRTLCKQYSFDIEHSIAEGGKTRFHSVQSGLYCVEDSSLVAIHDAVRPFVNTEVIERLFDTATTKGSAIPYIDMIDSIRHTDANREESSQVDRNSFVRIQTPQVFHSSLIKKAYSYGYDESFTDDASVYELRLNKGVSLVEGNVENIKITTTLDLHIAELLLK